MDGIGAAASIIALIELAAKVGSICAEYSVNLRNGDKQISRLQGSLELLSQILEQAQEQYGKANSTDLSASEATVKCLAACNRQLEDLLTKLGTFMKPQSVAKAKLRLLKWPLKQKEVEKCIQDLSDSTQNLSLAIHIDQTNILKNIKHKINTIQLPVAEGASFNSYSEQQNAKCHQETRVLLRQQIREWIQDPGAKHIFWLSGMAGTGKSTIARSVAQEFFDCQQLGASFFFKRGEAARGNASRFVTTIANQLAQHVPELQEHISSAIDVNSSVSSTALEDQFHVLILKPLNAIPAKVGTILMIIDALDEVGNEIETSLILNLLEQLDQVKSTVCIFLTSRPELPIRRFFEKRADNLYQNVVLDEISDSLIRHDIEAYLKDEFAVIRKNSEYELAPDWPGQQGFNAITNIAQPLFIAAATICRFVGDSRFDPEEQLQVILKESLIDSTDQLAQVYRSIVGPMISDLSEPQKLKLLKDFKKIVGAIVLLADSLSIHALANLLDESERIIRIRLNSLHAVLSVPSDSELPIRVLHLSFRDFLTSSARSEEDFGVDEIQTHQYLAEACLTLLSSAVCLKQNMCDIEKTDVHRKDISNDLVKEHLPSEVRYACRYWAFHLRQGQSSIVDQGSAHKFLLRNFLHWIEALVIMDAWNEISGILEILLELCSPTNSSACKRLLEDAISFFEATKDMLNLYPLQLYSSALVFTPNTNIIRGLYERYIPAWTKTLPLAEGVWNDSASGQDGHASRIAYTAVSPNGQLLATSSHDGTVKLWHIFSGILQHTMWVEDVAFSLMFSAHGRHIIAFITNKTDGMINVWDVQSGRLEHSMKDLLGVGEIAPSFDRQLVANDSLGDRDKRCSIQIWDMINYGQSCTISTQSVVRKVRFSSISKIIAVGLSKGLVQLVDARSKVTLRSFQSIHNDEVLDVRLSLDDKSLAALQDAAISIWSTSDGTLKTMLPLELGLLNGVVVNGQNNEWNGFHSFRQPTLQFSPDGQCLFLTPVSGPLSSCDLRRNCLDERFLGCWGPAALSPDGSQIASYKGNGKKTIIIKNVNTGQTIQVLSTQPIASSSIAWLPDSQGLVVSAQKFVELWSLVTKSCKFRIQTLSTEYNRIEFIANGAMVAIFSVADCVQIWDIQKQVMHRELHRVSSLISCFSHSGDRLASYLPATGNRMDILDVSSGTLIYTVEVFTTPKWVKFSPDDRYLACKLENGTVCVFDNLRRRMLRCLDLDFHIIQNVVFSPDSRQLALSYGHSTIELFNLIEDRMTRVTIPGRYTLSLGVKVEMFFPDNQRILCSDGASPFIIDLKKDTVRDLLQPLNGGFVGCDTAISQCGKYIAMLFHKAIVVISNLETSEIHRKIKWYDQVVELAFDSEAAYLQTDRGLVDTMIVPARSGSEYRHRIWIGEQWMQIDDQHNLWLPPRARPQLRKLHRGKLLLGYSSGQVSIFDYKTSTSQVLPNLPAMSR